MKRFVLDCSVTAAWCFEDQSDDYTDKVLESLSHAEALVPELWYLEMSNVLLVAERRAKISPTDSDRFLGLLSSLPIKVFDEKMTQPGTELVTLGRTAKLSAYDAAYLSLALSQSLPLATRDEALMKACKKMGVKIYK